MGLDRVGVHSRFTVGDGFVRHRFSHSDTFKPETAHIQGYTVMLATTRFTVGC